ncbi:MAG: hypothetical protein CM15mP73_4440 [Hyphomicrobiales bacterium]|nr:MAG: hypothetical protein CM15mP73_4440 [Hyphomicrobiales bacterium]
MAIHRGLKLMMKDLTVKMNFYLNRNLKDMNSILVELEKALNSET